jgi:ectoine hydroxylase-related dioxygenase (phytanoyl-CoA dioxygenase family)
LEKCTPQNGALSFLPGSHNTAPISKRFVRLPGGGTGFERLLPLEAEVKASGESKGEYLMVECAPGALRHTSRIRSDCGTETYPHPICLDSDLPGDLVLIHGSVLHKSERNTSPHTRFAYTFHMIESEPHAIYDKKNWLQPTPAMPFSRVLRGASPARVD